MSSMRSASSRTSIRTSSSFTSRRSTRSWRRPGRGDDDVRAAQPLGLAGDRGAAVRRCDAQPLRLGDEVQLLCHLRGELTRGHEHERGRRRRRRIGALDDRQAEGEGLARACRRLREHVGAREGVRDDELLDGKWHV